MLADKIRRNGKRILALMASLGIIALATGCASLSEQLNQILQSSETPTEADKTYEMATTEFAKAKELGIPTDKKAYDRAGYQWNGASNDSILGIQGCEKGDADYLKLKEKFEPLAKDVTLAYEQYFYDCMNAVDDPYWVFPDIFARLNAPWFFARMKDPNALFTTAMNKWKTSRAKVAQDLGGGSVRKLASATGEGACWFGASPIPAKKVNFKNLQWLYDNMNGTVNVGFVTKVKPNSFRRSGPDRVKVYYQSGSAWELFREFPVSADGSSDEYSMSIPLKPLDTAISETAKNYEWFTGDLVLVRVYYVATEVVNALETREVTLASGTFFLKRK